MTHTYAQTLPLQVRVLNSGVIGQWSEEISLGIYNIVVINWSNCIPFRTFDRSLCFSKWATVIKYVALQHTV